MSKLQVLREVSLERKAQDEKWGEQNHPNGTGQTSHDRDLANEARKMCEQTFAVGGGSWKDILREEVYEAFAEQDPATLRRELIQVAAVAVSWVEAIDRRSGRHRACPTHGAPK